MVIFINRILDIESKTQMTALMKTSDKLLFELVVHSAFTLHLLCYMTTMKLHSICNSDKQKSVNDHTTFHTTCLLHY